MTFKLFTDGGARGNPGPSGLGAVLKQGNNVVATHSSYAGNKTNNEAEYLALIQGLKLAKRNNVKSLDVYMDSQLIVKQLNGEYRVKKSHLIPLYNQVVSMVDEISNVNFFHIPRKENFEADLLVNKAVDDHLSNTTSRSLG